MRGKGKEPWPSPGNDMQVRLHNARVAISRAEDELDAFKQAKWLEDVRSSLDVANDILRGAFDKAGETPEPVLVPTREPCDACDGTTTGQFCHAHSWHRQ